MEINKMRKENSFLLVRNLLADALILNLKLQRQYEFLKISFEGSELEKQFIKLETRYRNETHLKRIRIK